MTYYKVLTDEMTGGFSCIEWNEDDWMPPIEGDLKICENGYHICREQDLVRWIDIGPMIYEVEIRGEIIESDDKVCVREARLVRRIDAWNSRSQRLFACDCAEHVLPLFEAKCPDDSRPRDAIAVARKFAIGEATKQELDAARAGAAAAAVDAVDATWAATWAASAADAAAEERVAAVRAAAWAEARAVAASVAAANASDAAVAAANASDAAAVRAEATERAWQTTRLIQYLRGEI